MNQNPADVAAAEGLALAALLRQLDDTDWGKPTDCSEWTVRDMTAHLVGQAESVWRPWIGLRRQRTGRRRYPDRIGLDAYTAQQIDDHAGQTGPELVAAFADRWPRGVTTMRRLPRLARRATMPSGVPGVPRISIGYLFDRILPRDLWMHRVDLSRATGRPMVLGPHDPSIVDDVLTELGDRWTGPPVRIELSGPAGGTWTAGRGDPVATVAAEPVDLLRSLAGRNPTPALSLVGGDPAAVERLAAARVVF